MKDKLPEIRQFLQKSLEKANDLKALEDLRVKLLGKKGELTLLLKSLSNVSKEERPVLGQLVNETRTFVEESLDNAKKVLQQQVLNLKLAAERVDVTMPGKVKNLGHKHPMSTVLDRIIEIFMGMGYSIAEGPDVETDYYNFQALNIPKDHPAKDEQDTFYVEGGFLLRTQTSPVQVRTMEKGDLPIKIICPGRVYRSDEVDATHAPNFHQIEGLVVDKGITMSHLKGTLEVFAKEMFGESTSVRFRPHHFPFTEPSAEMDISCFSCGGSGCRVCSDSGFIEILGCGMVHPEVLKMSGIDPTVYSGFAFGMGLERITMQRYNINDLRLLYENDVKFLKQF